MAIDDAGIIQTRLDDSFRGRTVTAFSPPGTMVEPLKYPIVRASVLAATQGSEFISIYDHPESWRGLDSDAVLKMRAQLIRFGSQVDARSMEPSSLVKTLQTVALSVNPLGIRFEVNDMPQRSLSLLGGLLPTGPAVDARNATILNEPEISRVAEKITEQDIPAAESVWKLLDYEYTLDQVARLMSVGLLGMKDNRRLIPTKSAYKASIDAFVSRALMELIDRPLTSKFTLSTVELHGDVFTVFTQPGMPRVDYLRIQRSEHGIERGFSFEGVKNVSIDPKTSIFADHARFAAYRNFIEKRRGSQVTVFHMSRSQRSEILGPWRVRAGVNEALEADTLELDSRENAIAVLQSLLSPNLAVWTQDTPLAESLNVEVLPVEPSLSAAALR